MRYREITESEQTDEAARQEANAAFDRIMAYLDKSSTYLEDVLTSSDALGGSYVMKGRRCAVGTEDDLLIIFTPKQKSFKGSFGHAGRHPIIVLTVLIAPHDLKYITTRLSTSRDTFVHEYMHYLAWSKEETAPEKSGAARAKGDASYYNHPEELNAYYQQATSGFWRIVNSLIELGHSNVAIEMWKKHPAEMVRYIMSKELDKGFVKALTPKNKRRIEKRLARFCATTILPMLDSQEESE